MCKEDKMICSNEGKTYPTICSLNEEAIERGEPDTYIPKLFMEYWGPCKEGTTFFQQRGTKLSNNLMNNVYTYFRKNLFQFLLAPVIMSSPENSYGPLGANLTLDCEARGYPAPTITWQFVSTEGKTISLPSRSM